jgi:hypothetical protein
MKKTIKTLALVVAITASLASCKKTYECHCDKIGGGDEHFDIKAKEDQAKADCEAKKTASPTVYSKCELE